MKLIYVMANREDDALNFKKKFGVNPTIQLWNEVKDREFLEIEINGKQIDLDVKALEFSDVDPNFIGFIRSALMYETRDSDIFIVNEN